MRQEAIAIWGMISPDFAWEVGHPCPGSTLWLPSDLRGKYAQKALLVEAWRKAADNYFRALCSCNLLLG
jgi:hypothetical protein